MKVFSWLGWLLPKHWIQKPNLVSESLLPEWWQKKIARQSHTQGTLDDLILSIRAALENSVADADARYSVNMSPGGSNGSLVRRQAPTIVLGVPDDNHEVMEILIRMGGEVRIMIRAADRPILELLTEPQPASQVSSGIKKDPNLPGFFNGVP